MRCDQTSLYDVFQIFFLYRLPMFGVYRLFPIHKCCETVLHHFSSAVTAQNFQHLFDCKDGRPMRLRRIDTQLEPHGF